VFEDMTDNQDGVCRFGKEIAIRSGMSEIQTVCAVIHEMTHAKLHDQSVTVDDEGGAKHKDRRTEEVEAESVSYAVCQYFGIETGDNSFGYLAEWSRNRDLKELNASLDTIRKTAAEMIDVIDGKFKEIVKERNITLAVSESQAEAAESVVEAEALVDTPETENDIKETSMSIERRNYMKFEALFPQIANGEYSYLRLEAGDGFMPLSVEWINSFQISLMHTYTLNGDLCYDPMIVYKVGYEGEGENEVKTLSAVEYEQSIPPLYQVYDADGRWLSADGNGNEKAVWGLSRSINEFTSQWFENIGQQGYVPVKANMVIGGETTQIKFDTEGNPVIPDTEITPAKNNDTEWLDLPEVTDDSAKQVEPADMPDNGKQEQIPDINGDNYADSDPSEPEQFLPDPSIGYSEMNLFGYSGDEILPLTQNRAIELFDADHTVYLLYPDNTEAMIFERDEIMSHDGIFGIERTVWESSLEYAAMKAESKNREGRLEAELLYGDGNRFGIYQVKSGEDYRDYCFASIEELQSHGLDVVRGNYKLVYTAPFPQQIEFLKDRNPVLNLIYDDYNTNHPDDYTGRSVSISDVIVLKCNSYISSHYVDSVGFIGLAGFLGDERQTAMIVDKALLDKQISRTDTYSQVGNSPDDVPPETPKAKPTLMERLAENKLKAARQGQQEPNKMKEREARV